MKISKRNQRLKKKVLLKWIWLKLIRTPITITYTEPVNPSVRNFLSGWIDMIKRDDPIDPTEPYFVGIDLGGEPAVDHTGPFTVSLSYDYGVICPGVDVAKEAMTQLTEVEKSALRLDLDAYLEKLKTKSPTEFPMVLRDKLIMRVSTQEDGSLVLHYKPLVEFKGPNGEPHGQTTN